MMVSRCSFCSKIGDDEHGPKLIGVTSFTGLRGMRSNTTHCQSLFSPVIVRRQNGMAVLCR
jgi:hypothetical protein